MATTPSTRCASLQSDAPRRAGSPIRRHSFVAAGAIGCALLASLSGAACHASVERKSEPRASENTFPTAEAAEVAALPDGPAKALVTERCLLCHGAGLIAQQRKDAAAWGRTVTQMRTWGTPIQDDDQTAIVGYLTQHYGPGARR